MSHTPQSPPTSPRRGKHVACQVTLLDDTTQIFHVPYKCLGAELLKVVAERINLLEIDYFDLEYGDEEGNRCWLDHEKALLKQIPVNRLLFVFIIKFYTPDPGLLEDDFTRYLFALQMKRDIASGTMQCQEHTAVLLASYIVQAELGDFSQDEYQDHLYVAPLKLLPHQNDEIDIKIMEHHKEHMGQTPGEADFNLLDTARKVEMYGIRLHSAKDHEGVSLALAVAHMGVLVFQNYAKINTFSWAKIRKLSFKRKKYLIKLHPEGYGYYKDTVEFYFDTRNACKNFWKKCIEHHSFFRCHEVKRQPRKQGVIRRRGSSFRYSGRTQKQLTEYVRESCVKRQPFERSTSMRTMSSTGNRSHHGTASKNATLNSRDIHFGMNTSASSGSHILEVDQHHVENRYENSAHAQHPGMSSFGRPDEQLQMATPPRKEENMKIPSYTEAMEEFTKRPPADDSTISVNNYPTPEERIDPSRFMITKNDRKMSAPAFPISAQRQKELGLEEHMSRSPEIANIPQTLQLNRDPALQVNDTPHSIHRTQSATQPDTYYQSPQMSGMSPLMSRLQEEELLPPPPPPIFEEDHQTSLSRLSGRERREEFLSTTSRTSTSAGSVTLTSASSRTEESEDEGRRKRYPADKAYYIAKELLMTERTYKKDLEVLTVWFRNAVTKDDLMPDHLMELLFGSLDQIYDFHCSFLKEIETRLHMWEGKSNAHLNGDYQRIGDIILNGMKVLQLYRMFLENEEEIVNELEFTISRSREFEQVYKDFESQKQCYLPLNTFLLKPAQRLLHYKLILERLLTHYGPENADSHDVSMALQHVNDIIEPFEERMKGIENLHKLIELQRDLVGLDSNLVATNRQFIREGCLMKLSRKGYQQRMFFLFSDMLVYTTRMATPALQFKVHGQLPLKGMEVVEADQKMNVANSFAIYGRHRSLLVAASTQEEKDKWLEDLQTAVAATKSDSDVSKVQYPSLKSNSSSECLDESHDDSRSPNSPDRQIQHRANTTMHVCWHRNTSVSMRDHNLAVENQLSGYLLRKFKNSNGWQKLWVVFTNFCLFFYKTYQDDFPLASLPLLGYSVNIPSEKDGIHKDYVVKLQFKNHVYFFRAESEYTFERWVEVISSATSTSHRTRMFSRLVSDHADQPPHV